MLRYPGVLLFLTSLLGSWTAGDSLWAQVAVRGQRVYTMTGPAIDNGVVIVRDGKVSAVGAAADLAIPAGFRVLEAAVVTPGLVDAHGVVGLAGIFNSPHDQDQLEHSKPVQPELRAVDAYNPREPLVEWVRSFGVTTVHTGPAPGELISGQSVIVKTYGNTVEDALLVADAAVVATLGDSARKTESGKSPGTRGKMMALLRAEFVRAQEYQRKLGAADADKRPARDLGLDVLGRVLRKETPLLVTAHRAQDIASALRLAQEFDLRLWLDGAAEAYLLIDSIKAAGVPVILHPTQYRAVGETENLSFETAGRLADARVPIAIQSGYESYVPKARVVLFEAAIAAANGLGFERALAAITIDAARILGVDGRVGSLAAGKDGDLALYDGDPFEYTSHCIGVIIDGQVVSETRR
ncbi:MAG: amidohydrolase family protein [Planctomycetota bacterium]